MKWVNIGVGQAALFIVLAGLWDRAHRGPILFGGALAAGLMYASYVHARDAGLRSSGEGTED